MKTKIINIFICLIAIASLTGCTHNNGDIGPLFGQWKVTTISIDGQSLENYDGNLFFSFQNQVFMQRTTNELSHEVNQTVGIWKYSSNDLIIDFSDPEYAPLTISGMIDGLNTVKVISLSNKKMNISYQNSTGNIYRLSLEKW